MRYVSSLPIFIVRLIEVCLLAIFVVAIACSPSSPEPTKEELILRSEMANEALNAQNWAGIYQLYPTEVRDMCLFADFEAGWNSNYEKQFRALQEVLGGGSEFTLVVETNSVALTGTEGYVTLELDAFSSNGQPVIENLVNDSAQVWKFIDGEWFINEPIPEQFC